MNASLILGSWLCRGFAAGLLVGLLGWQNAAFALLVLFFWEFAHNLERASMRAGR